MIKFPWLMNEGELPDVLRQKPKLRIEWSRYMKNEPLFLILEDDEAIITMIKDKLEPEILEGKVEITETLKDAFAWVRTARELRVIDDVFFFVDWSVPEELGEFSEKVGHKLVEDLLEGGVKSENICCTSSHPNANRVFPKGIRFCSKQNIDVEITAKLYKDEYK